MASRTVAGTPPHASARRIAVGLAPRLACLSLVAATLALAAAFAAEVPRGGLDARRGSAVVAPHALYAAVPLTVECFVQLERKQAYNILIAHEVKPSARHWELFTHPTSGQLSAYIPGRKPDHVHTGMDIVDNQWHYVAMVLEADRCRLFVDGTCKADAAVVGPTGNRVEGPLVIGALVTDELTCFGQVRDVRLSKNARTIAGVPEVPFAVDADTIGCWPLDRPGDKGFEDLSALRQAAVLRPHPVDLGPGYIPVAGGMSAAYQPLPPTEDAAPLRQALAETATRLGLASIDAASVRDAVLQHWSHEYACMGRIDYPESRGAWYQEPEALAGQVFDPQALVQERDGGPAGTVLRRTAALLAHLPRGGELPVLAPLRHDLAALQAAYAAEAPPAGTEAHRAIYLAACALRRQAMLANPLLDFDSLLFVARGTFAGSVRSNPGTADVQGGHFVTQYFGFNALPGGGLFVVRNLKGTPEVVDLLANATVRNGRLAGRKLDHGAFATPDLSFDGKTIVFAWTANSAHRWAWSRDTAWHLFRVDADGSNLVQLTDGAEGDFDPCWLPNGRIAFISERRGGHIRCFAAYLKVRNYTLFSLKDDGSDIVPLSYYETSEWNPTVNNEGQIVYTRWDYTDRENCLGSRLWLCGPDGTDPRAPHGNYPLPYHTFPDHTPWKRTAEGHELDSRLGTPLVEMGTRAVPNSPLYVFTAAPHHGEVFGSLCLLDLRPDDDGHMSQVRRITPYEPFPESENGGRRHYKYGSPWPLSEDLYLCNAWEDLVLLDRFGNQELLCDLRSVPCVQDERLRLIDPIPLRPRPCPPVLPSRTRQTGEPERRPATVAVMNVYESDLPLPEGTRIRWLRVVQNLLKSNHAIGQPMIGYERENTPRIPLGIVPVEEDGSVYFEAPVAKELIFQTLDEDYCAVQSMRSVAFVHPGEELTCLGCHEGPRKAPPAGRTPLALQRPPSRLQPEIGPVEPISYYRQVKPIIGKTCLPCHKERGKGPQDMSYEALREGYTFWFSGAMWRDMTSAYSGVHGGSRSVPGRFGARASKIGQALFDEAHRQAVSPEDRHVLTVWLDCNSLRLGAYLREEAQLRGELVWPELDVDPANVLGSESAGPPLRRNLWHENRYGPYTFLGTSHEKKLIYIMDELGRMVWDYPVANPQDVWLLPSGNVLTTHLHGVREVTPDRQVAWEYTVEPPEEVPSCQPLPNGNALIGIVGRCRLVELDRQGTVVHEIALQTTVKEPHAQIRMCRQTPEGTYLVPFTAEGAVREIARDGTVLREFPRRPTPICALRLDNGSTLVAADHCVTEYDRGDLVQWQLAPDDVPDVNLAVIAGLQRLDNGNTVICNWGTRDEGGRIGAHIFEVTPDKRVVWQVAGNTIGQVAQCQLLTAERKVHPGVLQR
jgi:hypothetical protein